MADISKSDVGFLGQFEPDVFWEQHGRKIVAGLVAVLAVGLAIFYRQRQGIQEEERAAARLATARDLNALETIVRDYPGKEVAAQAMLRLGDLHFHEGRLPDAAAVYQRFLTSYPQHNQAPAALFSLAAIQEAGGNFDAAKGQYLQLVSSHPDAYTAIAAKLGAARCAVKLGQKKEARQLYEELMPVIQGTQWQTEAMLGWTVLSRDAETSPAAGAIGSPSSAPATVKELNLPSTPVGPPQPPAVEKAP